MDTSVQEQPISGVFTGLRRLHADLPLQHQRVLKVRVVAITRQRRSIHGRHARPPFSYLWLLPSLQHALSAEDFFLSNPPIALTLPVWLDHLDYQFYFNFDVSTVTCFQNSKVQEKKRFACNLSRRIISNAGRIAPLKRSKRKRSHDKQEYIYIQYTKRKRRKKLLFNFSTGPHKHNVDHFRLSRPPPTSETDHR